MELEEQGSIFASTMDSEVIVHRLARSNAATPAGRLAEALQGVEGAYSLIVAIGDTLLAARDPRGWRPLAMGTLGDAIVFASETCALDIVGATHRARRRAGRDRRRRRRRASRRCIRSRAQELKRCVFEYVYFARPDSRILRRLGRSRASRARPPARAGVPRADGRPRVQRARLVELRGARLRRGERDFRYELALIRNHYVGRTFIQPTQAGRDAKVKVKYNPVREVLEGKSVVMVDDSIVRGTTTRGLVALVRAAGAREVHMRVSSPPVTGPCYYGIDTPSREELIAREHHHRARSPRISASIRSATCRSTAC